MWGVFPSAPELLLRASRPELPAVRGIPLLDKVEGWPADGVWKAGALIAQLGGDSRAHSARGNFYVQSLCENQNPCYTLSNRRTDPGSWKTHSGEKKRESIFFIFSAVTD